MKTRLIVVDVEADGPAPGLYSMVSFGAVVVSRKELYNPKFQYLGKVKPISDKYVPEALAVSNITREQHETYNSPEFIMEDFFLWVKNNGFNVHNTLKPVFISDNPAFDWQFINYYFHAYVGDNPFGFSARRIGDLYAGAKGNLSMTTQWKKHRKTAHTHNPVDDALGNAEALLHIIDNNKLDVGNILLD